MKTHHDSASVLGQACLALGNLATHDDNKVAIAAAGGITVRIAALLEHHLYPSLYIPLTSSPFPPTPTTEVSMTPDLTICPNANSNKNKTKIYPTLTKSSFTVTPIVSKLDINNNLNPDATPTPIFTR